jgi:hypothetical protein
VTLGVLILNFLTFVGLNHNFNVPLMQGIFYTELFYVFYSALMDILLTSVNIKESSEFW